MERKITQPTEQDLRQIRGEIDVMEQRAKNSRFAAREAFNQQLNAAKDQYELLKTRMEKAKAQSGAAAERVQEGISQAWSEVKRSVKQASSYLQ